MKKMTLSLREPLGRKNRVKFCAAGLIAFDRFFCCFFFLLVQCVSVLYLYNTIYYVIFGYFLTDDQCDESTRGYLLILLRVCNYVKKNKTLCRRHVRRTHLFIDCEGSFRFSCLRASIERWDSGQCDHHMGCLVWTSQVLGKRALDSRLRSNSTRAPRLYFCSTDSDLMQLLAQIEAQRPHKHFEHLNFSIALDVRG